MPVPSEVSGARFWREQGRPTGVEEMCVGDDLGLIELEPEHSAACHLTARQMLGV